MMNRNRQRPFTDKRALLTELLNGKVDKQALVELKQQQEPTFMVVCSNGEPQTTDLVDTRLPDEQGQTRVTYAEFLSDPVKYGQFCVSVDQDQKIEFIKLEGFPHAK